MNDLTKKIIEKQTNEEFVDWVQKQIDKDYQWHEDVKETQDDIRKE